MTCDDHGVCTVCGEPARLSWGRPGPFCQRHHRERQRARQVGYYAAHGRVKRQRGSASAQTCRCGAPAVQWAYTGPRAPGERLPWSDDLGDYTAMCASCHKVMDLAAIG